MWAVSTAGIFILACNFMIANCSTGGSSPSKGETSKDASEQKLNQLIGDIKKCFDKSLKTMNSENPRKVTGEVQEGIMSLLDAPFWKELQQDGGENNGQQMVMITLKEFHAKYESTLWAEFLFVEIKKLWPMLSDYKGKLETIEKNENAEKLKEYKNYVKKYNYLRNTKKQRPRKYDKYSEKDKYEWDRKNKIELDGMKAAKANYIKKTFKGIPIADLNFVNDVAALEGKIFAQCIGIGTKRSVEIAADRLSKDEIVWRVVHPSKKVLKVTALEAWLKKGGYDDRHSWTLGGPKDKFALNYVRSNKGNICKTPIEWIKRHKEFKDLESCVFRIDYQIEGDYTLKGERRTRSVEINLGEEKNKDFLSAKSGRFVVNTGRFSSSGSIKVDENAWDEETSQA